VVIDKKDLFIKKQMESLRKQLISAQNNLTTFTQEEVNKVIDSNNLIFKADK
jgi:hypothetical protein